MLTLRYLTIILLLFLSNLNSHATDQENKQVLHSATSFSVQIDEAIIKATGIQTQKLHSSQFNPEIETFATRVDLSSLIDARRDYFTAAAKQAAANIKYKQSRQDFQHLENLQREKAISTRKLLLQKSQLQIDKASYISAGQQKEIILLHTRSKWGSTLSHWFLTEEYPYTHMLNTLNRPVYLIYLPTPAPLGTTVSIHPFGLREKAQSARLISSATIPNNQQTGTPFFYLCDQAIDTYHQRVTAWLPLQEKKQSGFVIPESAMIWHLGQSFVYLQIDDNLFKRIKITEKKLPSSKLYFIQNPLQEGNILVITGAQMLLSEEFRGQIPAEDDDDDDD